MKKRVQALQTLINKANQDQISGVEPDSTWETEYTFISVKLLKTRLVVKYTEWDGIQTKEIRDSIPLSDDQDVKYTLSWIRRAIKKGYKYQRKQSTKD